MCSSNLKRLEQIEMPLLLILTLKILAQYMVQPRLLVQWTVDNIYPEPRISGSPVVANVVYVVQLGVVIKAVGGHARSTWKVKRRSPHVEIRYRSRDDLIR